MKECSKCGKSKDLKCFYNLKSSKDGKRPDCKCCHNSYQNKQYKKHGRKHHNIDTEKKKIRQLKSLAKKRYGITLEEYKRAMSTSDCCEICGSIENLCYDHCHIKGKGISSFRGVLCDVCNRGLGMFGDNISGIESALKYLRRYYEKNN